MVYTPRNYWDTRQTFSFIVRGSPDLTGAPAKYTPDIDVLLGALLQGIATVATKIDGAHAQELLLRCRDQVTAARERYAAGQAEQGKALLVEAEANFVEAGNAARRTRRQTGEGGDPVAG